MKVEVTDEYYNNFEFCTFSLVTYGEKDCDLFLDFVAFHLH